MKRILLHLTLLLIVAACQQQEQEKYEIIQPDLEKIQTVSLHDYESISLDSTRFIGRIKRIIFYQEYLLLQSGEELYGYNRKDGSFLTSFSDIGRSEGEYISLLGVWIEKGKVAMYDYDAQKILYFNLHGDFLDEKRLMNGVNAFQQLCPLDTGYVGRRTYSNGEVPELSFYDRNGKYIKSIGERYLNSGIIINYPFYASEEAVLYSPYFRNQIEEISPGLCTIKYLVDFKRYNFFNDSNVDEFELLWELGKGKRVATCISNIYESDKYFCFQFLLNGLGARYCVYDRNLKIAKVFSFDDESYSVDSMHTFDDRVNIFVRMENDSVHYYTMPLGTLFKINP